MKKEDKERVVAELTERLRTTETLLVADYRGLTMPQIDDLRSKLIEHGARFSVVKNTLTRRAAEAAGADALLALLEGPTAIAFLEADGDPVAVAKALADAARETRVLEVRGGLLEGRPIEADEIESLAKLPPFDVLRSQVLGAITRAADGDRRSLHGPRAGPRTACSTPASSSSGSRGTRPQRPQAARSQQAAATVEEPAAEAGAEPVAEEASGSEPQAEATETQPTETEN